MPSPNPSGKCQCGCGGTTTVAKKTSVRDGEVKGEHRRFLKGHAGRINQKYIIDPITGCWVWQLAKVQGYGRMWDGTDTRAAHRVYYERLVGPIPDGMFLDHICRNRSCVNPAHLRLSTPAENMHNRVDTRLTPQVVAEMKRLLLDGHTQRSVADRYGVHFVRVSEIARGKKWRSVEPAPSVPQQS